MELRADVPLSIPDVARRKQVNAHMRLRIVLCCLLGLFLYAAARCQAQQRQPAPTNSAVKGAQPATTNEAAEGEKRFRTNCGRCHDAPEDLSPREARTVVRQMRVRALLTAEDERLILKYIAP